METLMLLQGTILLWIQNNLRSDTLTPFFSFFTFLGNDGMVWIAIGAILVARKKTRNIGFLIWLSLFASLLICNGILKNLVQEARPFVHFPAIIPLDPAISAHSYSFPSGHASASFAAAFGIRKLGSPYGALAILLATLIAFSRMYLGVHFPLDVLGGLLTGYLSYKCAGWILSKRNTTS